MTLALEEFANRVLDRCESTNDLARKLGEAGYAHGTWVSARSQDRGRGRLGREWKGLEGNLFLSVLVRLPKMQVWPWIPLLTAIAITDALQEVFPEVSVSIKWPNDLWIEGAKLGGILCEAVGNRSDSFIVVGIGLNCAQSPEGIDQIVTSLTEALQKPVVADHIRSQVVQALLKRVRALSEDSALAIECLRRDYRARAALPPGTLITWSSDSASLKHGKVLALGESGELLVLNQEGEEIKLYAEDVKVRAVPQASGESQRG